MSHRLIARNPDLQRLRDEGYNIGIVNGYLLVRDVPYVKPSREVGLGVLATTLNLQGDTTRTPDTHVALWVGDPPCNSQGSPLAGLSDVGQHPKIAEGLVVRMSFSQKPVQGYQDYYLKMTTYVHIVEDQARALDPSATARTFPVVTLEEEESVFCYLDTASSRSGIVAISKKLERGRIAIVGLGGSGSYVLDHIAKTPVGEVHLFDGDTFLQHNAFRCPGAPSSDELREHPSKVAWFTRIYSRMRRKIIAHPQFIDETNVSNLSGMDFVFLCLDKGAPRRIVSDYLIENKIPFIDVGMGVLPVAESALGGLVRVTTCTPTFTAHLSKRVSFAEAADDEYARNIQISDLNALSAALAVIKWKKLWGFYEDSEGEHNSTYGITGNLLTNDDLPSTAQGDPT
jgi:hypothetical protein